MTEQGKCKDCKFYSETEQVVFLLSHFRPGEEHTLTARVCSRYPTHVKVSENHWCGEFLWAVEEKT
jgi:hypothetical protein